MKSYNSADLPFNTRNASLAFSLYLSGIPFADEKAPLVNVYDAAILRGLGHEGNVEAAARQAHLDGRAGSVEYGFAKAPALGSVLQAFDKYKPSQQAATATATALFGEVVSRLTGGELSLQMALAAATCVVVGRWRAELRSWSQNAVFTTQRRLNETGREDARHVCEVAFLGGDFWQFAACVMDARAAFLDLWKGYPPTIRLTRGASPSFREAELVSPKDGKKVVGKIGTFAGFVAYSTTADNETRRHIGVDTL